MLGLEKLLATKAQIFHVHRKIKAPARRAQTVDWPPKQFLARPAVGIDGTFVGFNDGVVRVGQQHDVVGGLKQ